MIQFNLLPDVKQEYVKARRTKRLVTLISIATSVVAVFVMLLLLVTVDVVQKKNLSDLNGDIKSDTQKLQGVPDLDKILTVQNQLITLTTLHDQKAVSSRLFTYVSQLTPSNVTISKLSTDYTLNTIALNGEAPSLDVVNAFVDTLKQTTYTTDSNKTPTKAFSSVVLTSFGRDTNGATYTINFSFDPIIFSNTNTVTLSVPSGSSTTGGQLFQTEAGN